MIEQRKFQRAKLTAKSMLSNDDALYQGQLENISLNGALVRFEQGVIVPLGRYDLAVYIEGEGAPLQFIVEIVCATNALSGMKFVSCEADTETSLFQLMDKLTARPDQLRNEQERFRKNIAEYLR
jgi:hypothetical protein